MLLTIPQIHPYVKPSLGLPPGCRLPLGHNLEEVGKLRRSKGEGYVQTGQMLFPGNTRPPFPFGNRGVLAADPGGQPSLCHPYPLPVIQEPLVEREVLDEHQKRTCANLIGPRCFRSGSQSLAQEPKTGQPCDQPFLASSASRKPEAIPGTSKRQGSES